MHKELKSSLPSQNFLAYSTTDNDFKIRFENEEKPIEISNILRASSEGKVYNISLGEDSQITATKKGSERHYDFTGSNSGMFKKVCQTTFLAQLNFQSIRKENIKLRDS